MAAASAAAGSGSAFRPGASTTRPGCSGGPGTPIKVSVKKASIHIHRPKEPAAGGCESPHECGERSRAGHRAEGKAMVQTDRKAERVARKSERREGVLSMEPRVPLILTWWRKYRVGGGFCPRSCATPLLVGSLALAVAASGAASAATGNALGASRRPGPVTQPVVLQLAGIRCQVCIQSVQ